ncbi:MAG: MBL fold metallo-hydrolase [bacterium]
MKNKKAAWLILGILLITLGCSKSVIQEMPRLAEIRRQRLVSRSGKPGKVTFIYGNRTSQVKGCQPAWGMVTLTEFDGLKILFNAGGDPVIFKHNLETLNIDIKDIDLVVISHEHWEMLEGIGPVLERNPRVKIYVTRSLYDDYPSFMTHDLSGYNWKPEWQDNLVRMHDYQWVTPNILLMKLHSAFGRGGPRGIEEIHLVLLTEKGLVIAQGCGHPEILDIMSESQDYTDENRVHLIYGGTRLIGPGHSVRLPGRSGSMNLMSNNITREEKYEIARELKKRGVQWIIPTHCTGPEGEAIFKEVFGDRYINQKLGMVFRIPAPAGRQ